MKDQDCIVFNQILWKQWKSFILGQSNSMHNDFNTKFRVNKSNRLLQAYPKIIQNQQKINQSNNLKKIIFILSNNSYCQYSILPSMANPIQQASNNRYQYPAFNSQQPPNQYLTNYNSSMPIKLNQQKVTNSQGKQIAYIANPREEPPRASNKSGSIAEEQEFRQSRQKQSMGNPKSELRAMNNEHLKTVEKQESKFGELRKNNQRESRAAGGEESGHMFCGSIGWIIGCIIGLLILTALLLFGLGVFGGPINQSDSQNSSKVSSKQPDIALLVEQVQSQKPIVFSKMINNSSVVDSPIIGNTSISALPSSANKFPVSTVSPTIISRDTTNKL